MTRPRRNKYGAKKTLYNGRTYDSKAEATYARRLDLLLEAGEIASWEPQPKFDLGGFNYKADFLVTNHNGNQYAVDVKGVELQRFRDAVKMWVKWGQMPLFVVKRGPSGDGLVTDRVIEGGRQG